MLKTNPSQHCSCTSPSDKLTRAVGQNPALKPKKYLNVPLKIGTYRICCRLLRQITGLNTHTDSQLAYQKLYNRLYPEARFAVNSNTALPNDDIRPVIFDKKTLTTVTKVVRGLNEAGRREYGESLRCTNHRWADYLCCKAATDLYDMSNSSEWRVDGSQRTPHAWPMPTVPLQPWRSTHNNGVGPWLRVSLGVSSLKKNTP